MTTAGDPRTASRTSSLRRRIRIVVALTIGWNVLEAIVALASGTAASSTALIGFGLDSVAEVLSAAAVAWQFAGRDPESRERTTLRIVAASFLGLAAVVTLDAVLALSGVVRSEVSIAGVVLTSASLVVMPVLSLVERHAGRLLGSASAVADSRQTLLCALLSAAALGGLLAHAILDWRWADPVAGLVIAALAMREGVEAWRGEGCATAPELG